MKLFAALIVFIDGCPLLFPPGRQNGRSASHPTEWGAAAELVSGDQNLICGLGGDGIDLHVAGFRKGVPALNGMKLESIPGMKYCVVI